MFFSPYLLGQLILNYILKNLYVNDWHLFPSTSFIISSTNGLGNGSMIVNLFSSQNLTHIKSFFGSCFLGYTTVGLDYSELSMGYMIMDARMPSISFWTIYLYLYVSLYGLFFIGLSPSIRIFISCYSKICLTIAILHRGPFSISLCRLFIPFLMNPELKIYIFPHIRSLTAMQDAYTLVAPLQLAYIGICARKYKMRSSFHVTTKDL
jgi:hypothetical protein